MKIVKAQKKIARLKGEIKEIKKRMSGCLSTVKGNAWEEDFNTLDTLLGILVSRLSRKKQPR
jgi:hypothetical protein